MTAAVPAMVRFVKQSGHHSDCSIAALAMLAGVLYEDALAAAVSVQPAALHTGLNWPQIRAVARRLGLKTKQVRRYDLEEATGILDVRKPGEDHVVFLWEGRIVDGCGELWKEPDEYLKHYNYQPRQLLITVD